ncbi:DsbA family protein [Blastococcus brunescens]|uniref:DsbA family protein n=1 Tax=Blastococcus brunescens TaxID=1564165 RepID=A0ABZ1B8U1_9ACTN|nr:DsbA family protein [Blastococcus sp. BMG 8361]WRL67237.1 DsbA family protein [Blastococcus sp. BMG 8361]
MDHVRGPVDAPLTLVEYGDMECPFCGRATGVVSELRNRFGDDLRYVFRHLPLLEVHPHAQLAAEAVEAAGAQGRFWEMHDKLFAHQDALEAPDLLDHASALGLDLERFARELGDGTHAQHIRDDVAGGEASGVEGTPTFFVNGVRHTGRAGTDELAAALLRTDPRARPWSAPRRRPHPGAAPRRPCRRRPGCPRSTGWRRPPTSAAPRPGWTTGSSPSCAGPDAAGRRRRARCWSGEVPVSGTSSWCWRAPSRWSRTRSPGTVVSSTWCPWWVPAGSSAD